MEREEIIKKALCIRNLALELMSGADEEPFLRANAESVYAHARLLCNELGLDICENTADGTARK